MTTAQELYMNLTPHVLAACVTKPGDMVSAKQMADSIVRECVGECARLGLLDDVQPVARQAPSAPGPAQFGAPEFAAPQPSPIPPVETVGYGPQGLARFVEAQPQGNGGIAVVPVGQPHQPAQHYNVVGAPASAQPPAPAVAQATPWYPPHLAHLHQPQPTAPTAVPPPVASPAAMGSAPPSVPWFPPHLAHLFQPTAPPAATVPVVGNQGPGYAQGARVASGAGTVAQQQQPYDVGGTKIVPPTGSTFQPPNQAGVMNNVVHVATPQGHSALGTDGVIAQPIQRPNSQDTIVAPANQSVITQAGGAGTQFVPEHIVR
jgi:hypothetical protein